MSRASVRSLKGQQTYLNGGPTNTLKKLGGERMKTAQDNTPDRISSVCGGVRVWRYRFCRVGPLELVRRRFKNKSQGLLWCDGGCGEDCSLGSTLSLARFWGFFDVTKRTKLPLLGWICWSIINKLLFLYRKLIHFARSYQIERTDSTHPAKFRFAESNAPAFILNYGSVV